MSTLERVEGGTNLMMTNWGTTEWFRLEEFCTSGSAWKMRHTKSTENPWIEAHRNEILVHSIIVSGEELHKITPHFCCKSLFLDRHMSLYTKWPYKTIQRRINPKDHIESAQNFCQTSTDIRKDISKRIRNQAQLIEKALPTDLEIDPRSLSASQTYPARLLFSSFLVFNLPLASQNRFNINRKRLKVDEESKYVF